MAAYEFIAITPQGKREKGTLEADSSRLIRQQLRDKDWLPLSVQAVAEQKKSTESAQPLFQRGLSATELATLTRQLATLIQAAMPVEESLYAVAAQQEKRRIKNTLLAIRSRVLEGYTLAQSLEAFPGIFPPMYRATVAAGESSGYLDRVLNQLADYTEARMQSIRKIQQALLYPLILVVTAIAIISFLLGYVVPDVIKVFVDSGQTLPWITRALIHTSESFQSYWPFLLGITLLLFLAGKSALKNKKLHLLWHRTLLKLPMIGKFSRTANTARFASTLSILSRSGVSLVEALTISAQVINNLAMKQAVEQLASHVSEGTSLNKAMMEIGLFPPLMVHMVASGESTGELDQMLEHIAHSQSQELENKTAILLGLFEPLMLVVMGGIVMLIVLAILLPILNMNQLLGF
ncbi:type II secretion system inner membrane protein GspF [Endozoicomonas numazuensis]|uniref:General secretion pathway protein F n=1 Tax=Endozoicomonas numazuensis TaxID=1137799 RepID=A0A081NHZ9_9GAMM|nr:type II secretion system inner membrane protein GspF [Endozoicomonas numazuensis]KEQ18072.1 general secretion pathway protein GspF [Endozoicomonas numazuensis]